MRSLIILVATAAVVSGLREMTPGFAVDFQPFGSSPVYREQRLPDREQARSFRELTQPPTQQQLQPFREESFRNYGPPFPGREEIRLFHDDSRNGFKGDTRMYKEESGDAFKAALRTFNEEARQFRDEASIFKDDVRSFKDESGPFREERPFTEESRPFREGPRHFRDERPFRDERRQYRDEIRPYRDEYRTFRDESRPFRDDFRRFEGQRNFRDESRPFRNEPAFKDDSRPFRNEPRPFKDEPGQFRNEPRPFKDESGQFRNEPKPFKDESGQFRNEPRPLKDESGQFRNEPRPFKDESGQFRNEPRPFKDESGQFRNEPRPFKDESGQFRNEPGPFKDESGQFRNEPRPFKDASGQFRNEPRPFEDESGRFTNEPRPYKDESGQFRHEPRPFKDESGKFRNEPKPFKDESGPFRNEPRPFSDGSPSFKDEILFTQESQSLAEAQHRYNKEQENRQPLSFGGHSNYLKFGNHGLGFASVPAAVLPLEDSSSQRVTEMMRSEYSQTAATQSPGTSSPREISDSKNQISVTLAPEVGSTASQSPSGNTIDSNPAKNGRKNEKLAGEASTSQASTAVTISTSGGTNVTPKVVFGSGSASMSNSPMGITNVDTATGVQQANTASALHASKSSMHQAPSTNSYFPSATTAEVPPALLNYIFKYPMPQETKIGYVYRQSLPSESFNHIQTVPLVHHHQTAKYGYLPEFKIPGLSAIHQPGGTINYVSTTGLPKVSYLNGNPPGLALGTSYSAENVQPVNFAQNLIQLGQGGQFSQLGQTENLHQLQTTGQNEQFPQFRQLSSTTNLNTLGQYGQFGQNEQPRSNPFNQGGLQLQLGGFGGIDYSALSSNSEASRASPAASLGIAKVGLSFAETPRPPAPAFTKLTFGESLW